MFSIRISRIDVNIIEIHWLHNMADKKDEGKETQEKETKKTEEKEPELVSHTESCNVTVLVYQMINDGVVFSLHIHWT